MEELRITSESKLCVRSDTENSRIIEGYASVFDIGSKLIAEDGKMFIEHINRQAFSKILASDLNVIMNRDHDDKKILARTKSNTLELSVDDYGLKYSFSSPNTVLGDETLELVKRGDLYESSFRYSFSPKNVKWWRDEKGMLHREIKSIERLMDTSIVVNGAFTNTTISLDSALRELTEFESHEVLERELKESARKQELDEYYNKLQNKVNEFK